MHIDEAVDRQPFQRAEANWFLAGIYFWPGFHLVSLFDHIVYFDSVCIK